MNDTYTHLWFQLHCLSLLACFFFLSQSHSRHQILLARQFRECLIGLMTSPVFQISSEGVACSVHPLDTVVAVGSQDGYLYIFKLSDGAQVGSFRVCGQPLNCISYSPGQ